MSKRILITLAVVVAVAAVAYTQTVERHLEPCQPRIDYRHMAPSPGLAVASDGNTESDVALAEIAGVLARHDCQLGVVIRISDAGQLEPRIVVEHPVPTS